MSTLAAGTSALQMLGVTVSYGSLPVLRAVDLEVRVGEIVTILGANGAGKTTLLLAAVGQLQLVSGEVRIFGAQVSVRHPSRVARLGVATVPDDRGLFLQLSVADNLRLVHPRRASIDEVFAAFPALPDLMGRKCGLLSGGEQQMLALAKAMLSRPRLLVIDEMSHGLAPKIAERLLEMVRQLADRHSIAVLLVEQHVHMALAVAHRAAVLCRGEVALTGSTAELLASPELVQAAYVGAQSVQTGHAET